jgi:nucleolar protein 6
MPNDNNYKPNGTIELINPTGNLPYSANHESLTKHFEKNPPALIRVATKKEAPSKCRGFAFIEFDNYDRMKTCLKLYHHSMFDDGKYPPRRMNVELT